MLGAVWLLLQAPAIMAAAKKEEGPASPYVELKPAFIANFGQGEKMRYLKADVVVRVEPAGAEAIARHMPLIRDRLVMLFSRQTEEELSSQEGMELLRQNALAAVQQVIEEEEGSQQVTDLLFNSFVIQ